MIKFSDKSVWDENSTLLVDEKKKLTVAGWCGTIFSFPFHTKVLIHFIVDGPNWAVEEVESRFN